MEAHGLSPEILTIVREYEALRMARTVPQDVRKTLQQLGQDFALVRLDGCDTWTQMERVSKPGGTRELRALVGALGSGSVATLWHTLRDGHLAVDLKPELMRVVGFTGEALPLQTDGGRPLVPVNSTRTTLVCPSLAPGALREALETAELRLRKPAQVWIRAADFDRVVGEMSLGSNVAVREPQAFGDVLLATGQPAVKPVREWFAEYTINIPREGLWAIWARVRYPRGSDDSFGFVVGDEEVTLADSDSQVLGNCGVAVDRWHWTGRGAGSTTVPPGQPLTRRFQAGSLTFRIYAREGSGTPQTNPQLDLLCFTEDPTRVPTDADARAWLETK